MDRKKKRWLLGCGCGVLGLCVLGGLAFLGWAVSERRKPGPVVEVMTFYPGMSASSIEKTITNRIERWVNQAEGAEKVTSSSLAGVSIVRITFRNDIDPNAALTQVNELVLGVLPTLPPDTVPPIVLPRDPSSAYPVGLLGISSSTADDRELQDLAKMPVCVRLLNVVPGAIPVVLGGKERSLLTLNFDPKKLAAHKVSPKDVRTVVETLCDKVRIYNDKNGLLMQASGRAFPIINLVKALPVHTADGAAVRLGELGIVQEQSVAPTVRHRIDGQPVVGVPVYLQQGAKRKDISEKIADDLPSLQDALPPEVKARWVPLGVDHKWLREHDNGLLTIYLRAPSYLSLAETEKRVSAVEEFLQKTIPANEREAIVAEVGLTPDWLAILSANAGPMDATIYVQLSAARTQSAAAYASKLRGLLNADMDFADLRFRFASQDMPEPVNIRVTRRTSGEAKEARKLAEDVNKQLGTGIKGIVDCEVVQRMDAPTLTICADLHKAAALGLSCREVIAQAAAALKLPAPPDQELFTDLRSGDQSVTLPLQLRPGVDVGALADAKVVGGKAELPVKLSALATVQRGTTAIEIDHEDLLPVLNVRANIEGRDRGDVIADIRKMLMELQAPQDMRVELVD
ncbi:MAG TPA: efflux RND transporter permease subunit [Gemmataceae bacterium]|jgi:multidrug efflux pump subunit AcrB